MKCIFISQPVNASFFGCNRGSLRLLAVKVVFSKDYQGLWRLPYTTRSSVPHLVLNELEMNQQWNCKIQVQWRCFVIPITQTPAYVTQSRTKRRKMILFNKYVQYPSVMPFIWKSGNVIIAEYLFFVFSCFSYRKSMSIKNIDIR